MILIMTISLLLIRVITVSVLGVIRTLVTATIMLLTASLLRVGLKKILDIIMRSTMRIYACWLYIVLVVESGICSL
jgi:hypothetical protein